MRSEVERSYIEQGYTLPEGLTWDRVDALRARWDVAAHLVPEVVAGGCVGWGVPRANGKPMRRP